MRSVRRQALPALAGRCRRTCAGSGEAQREAEGRAEGPAHRARRVPALTHQASVSWKPADAAGRRLSAARGRPRL
eukprot:3197242-Lingulodinium_polyedra.AAC.1